MQQCVKNKFGNCICALYFYTFSLKTNIMALIKIKSRTKEVEEYDKVVVALLSHGNTVAEIANKLNENKRTMEAKISRIKKDYNCKTLPQLTALFIKNKAI